MAAEGGVVDCMRMVRRPLLLSAMLAALPACGGETGFRINDVTVSPSALPINPDVDGTVQVGAEVLHDRQEVLRVWVTSEEGPLWIEMEPRANPRWSGALPFGALYGFPARTYRLDVHALDAAGREVILDDAVRFRIEED